MNPVDAYVRVAQRSVKAARVSQASSLHESSGFYAYHAFESIGGAVCHHRGRGFTAKSHPKKINQFVSASKSYSFFHAVARVSIILSSVRNRCLYPEQRPDGSMELPENWISAAQAQDMTRRVNGVIGSVLREV